MNENERKYRIGLIDNGAWLFMPHDDVYETNNLASAYDRMMSMDCPEGLQILDVTIETVEFPFRQYTRRTNAPKLDWLRHQLDEAGIRHRLRGESFHAPILEVEAGKFNEAWGILDPVDDIADNDKQFKCAPYSG